MSQYEYALYCRGFVFSDEAISPPKSDWHLFKFSPDENKTYHVWYDKKNEISYHRENGKWCFIVGMAMDTIDWHMELDLVCKGCVEKLNVSLNDFYDYIDNLNGRFALFFSNGESVRVLNDATATRSVYYHEIRCLIASHYEIIASITGEEHHPYYAEYNKITKYKPWTLPGDMTPYNNIRILTANHEFDVGALKLRRFYPRANHKLYSIKEILTMMPTHLKNQMNTLARYHTPIISVTRGNDSKVTLSASKDIRHKATYFTFANEITNHKDLDQRHRFEDSEYAKQICSIYSLNFKPLVLKPPLKTEMMEIVKKNHYHQHIASAIPEYLDKLPSGVYVQSNLIEIVRDLTYVYPKPPKNNTKQEIMAGWMMYWNQRSEIKEHIDSYWNRNEWDNIYDFERVRLFYWEHRMSTWNSAATLLENDWAFNTYLLLNCRKLLEMGFCLPKYARDKNLITKYTVNELWPELLFRVENSDDTLFDYFEIDSCGKLNLKENSTINSNLPERVLYIPRLYGALIGTDKTSLHAGDYCELVINNMLIKKKTVELRISAPTNSSLEPNNAVAYVKAGDKTIYEVDITDLSAGVKTIAVSIGQSDDNIAVGIRAISDIDCGEYGNYAMLNIDSVRVQSSPVSKLVEIAL